MKNRIMIILALIVLLTFSAASAQDTALAPLPEMGEVIGGFEVIGFGEIPDYDAKTVEFVHQETGAKALYIQNSDNNLAFATSFKTPSRSYEGFQHVLEHSLLSGSQMYPGNSVVFDLFNRAYLTFANAYTYPNLTMFPFSTTSEKEFMNTAKIYLSFLFEPDVEVNPMVFKREGIRYELNDRDAELNPIGVVYNEMQGGTSVSSAASEKAIQTLYPDTPDHFSSGGVPEHILDLTYDELMDYYHEYYAPSKAKVVFYGNLDYRAFLEMINENFFAGNPKMEPNPEPAEQTPFTEVKFEEYAQPVSADAESENQASINYVIALPKDLSDKEYRALQILVNRVFSNQAFPLYQRLMETGIGSDYWFYFDESTLQPSMYIGTDYADQERSQELYDTVQTVLNEVVTNGIDQELLDAIVSSELMKSRLSAESSTKGLNLLVEVIMSWQMRNDPLFTARKSSEIEEIAALTKDGFFEEIIRKYFLDNKNAVVFTAYPEPGGLEKEEAQLKEDMAAKKAVMSEEEIDELITETKAYNEWLETASTPQSTIDELSVMTVDDLPENVNEFEVTDETVNDIRLISAISTLPDVDAFGMDIDVSGLSAKTLQYLDLYSSLVGELPTESYTLEELSLNTTKLFYYYIGLLNPMQLEYRSDEFRPDFSISAIYLHENGQQAAELLNELFFKTLLTEESIPRIKEVVDSQLGSTESSMKSYYGFTIAQGRANFSASDQFSNYFLYQNQLDFLTEIQSLLESDPQAVLDNLTAARTKGLAKNNLTIEFAGEDGAKAQFEQDIQAFLSGLSEPATTDESEPFYQKEPVSVGYKANTSVDYSAMQAAYDGNLTYSEALSVLATIVNDGLYYPEIREKGGAYGGSLRFYNSFLQSFSYQDPDFAHSIEVYKSVPDFLRNSQLGQKDLDQYIITTYAGFEDTSGDLSKALTAIQNYLIGKTKEDQLNEFAEMKSITLEDIPMYADKIEAILKNPVYTVSAPGTRIVENADLFDSVEVTK